MEVVLYTILMIAAHGAMMFFMPGMHGGHGKKHVHDGNNPEEFERLKTENRDLQEEVRSLRAELNRY